MTGFAVRSAGIDDVDAVLELWRTAAENESRPADTRAAVVALLERDPAALLVAVSDTQLIGSLIAGWGRVASSPLPPGRPPRPSPPGRRASLARRRGSSTGRARRATLRRHGARRERARPPAVAGRRLPPPGRVGPLGQDRVGPSPRSARSHAARPAGRSPCGPYLDGSQVIDGAGCRTPIGAVPATSSMERCTALACSKPTSWPVSSTIGRVYPGSEVLSGSMPTHGAAQRRQLAPASGCREPGSGVNEARTAAQ